MHLLTIVFGPSPTPIAFLFKSPQLADKAYFDIETAKQSKAGSVNIIDEFGQRGCFEVATVHGFVLEDMDQSKLAHIERGLHQMRTQAKAQQMAGSDPALRTAAMTQGPAILSPMPGNGRFS